MEARLLGRGSARGVFAVGVSGSVDRGAGAGFAGWVVVRAGYASGGRGECSGARERVEERLRPGSCVVDA